MNRHSFTFAFVLAALAALSGCAMERGTGGSASAVTGRPYFQVFEAENGDHYFRLRAANHETILASQGYSSRTGALNGVLSVLDNGERTGRYEARVSSNGQHYFVLKASNGRVIGTSEMYASRSGAAAGIAGVQENVGRYLDWLANRTGARFDVFRGADGRFYFNLHASNGEIVLSSQGYADEADALNGTFSVTENGLDPASYDVREASNGGFYFNVVASNGRVIGTSEVYATRYNAERATESVMALLEVVDLL